MNKWDITIYIIYDVEWYTNGSYIQVGEKGKLIKIKDHLSAKRIAHYLNTKCSVIETDLYCDCNLIIRYKKNL